MMSDSPRWRAISALVFTLFVAACGRSGDEAANALRNADGILGYVPADTPYVFATPERLPDDVREKLEASADSMYAAYQTVIEASFGDVASELEIQGDAEQAELVMTLASEFVGLMQSENLRAAGVPASPYSALYGVGLLPVLRLELSNPVAFDAKIAELEANAGGEMSVGEVEGVSYRFVGDDSGRIIIAIIDDYVVATIAPTALSDEQLANVLGINKPDANIAESGALESLAEAYGFAAYGLGYVDMLRMVNVFLDSPTGVNAELLSMMEFDTSTVSDICKTEIREVAGIMPRVAAGYTDVSATEIGSNTVFELRSDIATGMSALAAPVPGLGSDHGGLGSFGLSIDLLAAREFAEARLEAFEADPYECEYFEDMAMTAAQMRMSLNQPVPPIAYGTKGFLAVIDRIEGLDMTGQSPPEQVDARVLLASDNAAGLLAMGAMFSPELAALDLPDDGTPVALDVPQLTGQFGAAHLAMTNSALGLSIGNGDPEKLSDLLNSAPADPPPSMSMRLDGERYYTFMSEAVQAGNAAGPEAEQVSPEVQAALSQVMSGIGDMIERIAVDITFTERGIEMPATLTLAD